MNLNNQNKAIRTNFRVDNKPEKVGDKLFYNGIERSELMRIQGEGLI